METLVTTITRAAVDLLPGPVGPDTDLFDTGADSVTTVQLVNRLRQLHGCLVTPPDVVTGRTPRLIAEIVAGRSGSECAAGAPLVGTPRGGVTRLVGGLPVSQHRMWYLEQQRPGSGDAINPMLFRIRGPLDLPALARALSYLVDRHSALRTILTTDDGWRVTPLVLPPGSEPELSTVEVAGAGLLAAIEGLLWEPFDMGRDRPLRSRLFRLGPADHCLALGLHQTAYDGWSDGLICRDLAIAYRSFHSGQEPDLPAVPGFQEVAAEVTGAPADEQFWLEHLRGVPDMPCEMLPSSPSGPVDDQPVRLSAVNAERLRRTCRCYATMPSAVYLAAWILALREETGADDFAVGLALAGRTQPAAENVVGAFASSAILRFPSSVGAGDCLQHATALLGRVLTDQFMPLERLYWELQPTSTGRAPFCQVGFLLQGTEHPGLVLPGLSVTRIWMPQRTSVLELCLALLPVSGGDSHIWYRTDAVSPQRAARLAERWLWHVARLGDEVAGDASSTVDIGGVG
ncbi:MAG: hypothetical protein J2P15_00135 [Micromonosporaceae bacterium]|nr:hypothetical protein [Micromonosporaceae bacterium]